MLRRAPSRPHRPPKLVLRFAVYAAGAITVATGAVLVFTRSYAGVRAEESARFHSGFIADSILTDRLEPSDFEAPVAGERRAQLDTFFRREVLGKESLRVKLYSRGGLVTYSNNHPLIGTRPDGGEVREALGGKAVSDVTHLNAEGGSGGNLKVLETYVRVRLGGR